MKAAKTLPLGIDIGQRRVRVALAEQRADGGIRLTAVAAIDHAGDCLGALHAAIDELGTSERRCVLALSPPEAILAAVDFPAMPPWERAKAARFEAARFIDYPVAEATISISATDLPRRWVIGVARRSALTTVVTIAKQAGLHPLGLDDAAFALQRAQPQAEAIIDVGDVTTRVMIYGATVPFLHALPMGGRQFTAAIARSLGIDEGAAEERKRSVGFAGAGESELDSFIGMLDEALAEARTAGHAGINRIDLCGNGSRVPGIDDAIARATGYAVHAVTMPADISDVIPGDVLRAAAPDWLVAYGLALWSVAA